MTDEEKAEAKRKKDEFLKLQKQTSSAELQAREKKAESFKKADEAVAAVKATVEKEAAEEAAVREAEEAESRKSGMPKVLQGGGAIVTENAWGVKVS